MNLSSQNPATQPRRPRVFMLDLLATVPYYTAYLSRALLAQGVDVTVGSISYYLDRDCFRSRGLTVHPGLLDLTSRFDLPRLPRRFAKLVESLLNLAALSVRFLISPPQLVHVQYLPMLRWPLPFDLWFIRLLQRRGSRLLLTVHDLLPHDTGERHRQVFSRLYHRVDGIICHSASIKDRLVSEFGIPPEKIAVIPHGPFFYDLPEEDPVKLLDQLQIPEGRFIALWQGILFPYKGVDLLLNAWAAVERSSPSATLIIAGTGSTEILAAITRQIADLGLRHVIVLPRFVSAPELVSLYRMASIVIYPYRAITTSGALSTGLALGKVIVASDLPVFRELLTDRRDALLVDPADSQQLSSAILELIQNPALLHQLAESVRNMRFAEQSWSLIAHQTAEVYTSLLNPHSPLGPQ